MYTLYYSPGACSLAIHVLLNELNVPFKAVQVSLANPSEEFKQANPRGQVPVLMDGTWALREGAAIILYLLEKHPSELLPESGADRARAIEWLMFGNSTMHPNYGKMFWLKKLGSAEKHSDLLSAIAKQAQKHWDDVEQALSQNAYVAGDRLTMADILLAVIANWSGNMQPPLTFGEKTKSWLQKIVSRPSFQKALADEGVEYKAAA